MNGNNKKITYTLSMILLLILVFLFFILPKNSFSPLENRALSKRPVWSLETLWSGSYTHAIDTYIEDHFPLRTIFIKINALLESIMNRTEKNDVLIGKDGFLFEIGSESAQNIKFNLESIDAFVKNLDVTFLLVPNSSRVYTEKLPIGYTAGTGYQEILNFPLENINFTEILPELLAKKNEKLYYRSDHHWTNLGAEIAYIKLMEHWGLERKQLPEEIYPNFLGSYYAKTLSNRTHAENFSYWVQTKASYSIEGKASAWVNEDKLKSNDKYAALMNGNPARAEILGNGEGKLLIFKDSYANALLPLLAENFASIEIVDLRYFSGNIPKLVKELQTDKILFLYGERSISKERSIGFALTR